MRGQVTADARFVGWCPACEWNIDPGEPEEEDRREAVRRARAQEFGGELLAELLGTEQTAPRREPSARLALALGLAVHALTLVVLGLAVWCLTAGWPSALPFVGLLLLALAWGLRPRFARVPEDAVVLRRTEAPELYALVDEIAAAVGTRGVDLIAIDAEVNASAMRYGARGRMLLTLGLPLWEILGPEQRLALLGHELAHHAHGDTRHGRVLATASRSLETWDYYLAPEGHSARAWLNTLVLRPPWWLVRAARSGLTRLCLRSSLRAEYLADRSAARVASTRAATELLDRILVADAAFAALSLEDAKAARVVVGSRAARGQRPEPATERSLWDRLAASAASVPETEYERRRRLAVRHGHRVDSTHPPTHLRREALLAGPPRQPLVRLDAERERRVAAEMAGARNEVGRKLEARA
ncbi:M48 family metallopeptidase [Streptomyces sp. NPDC047046]|uniref:M48 family metallopeptidase n=1 Tax=Streptomyces sp. NPDC047046 TaxID=3155378 RepID=UPI003400A365